jgi:alanine dehydrogenase
VYEKSADRIRYLRDTQLSGVEIVGMPFRDRLGADLAAADLVVNTVALPAGDHLVDRAMMSRMKPGRVIVDVAARPGGAIQTVDRFTTLSSPSWIVGGVIHCAVPNLPGAVARSASEALSQALLPYLLPIAEKGLKAALSADTGLARAVIFPGTHTAKGECRR